MNRWLAVSALWAFGSGSAFAQTAVIENLGFLDSRIPEASPFAVSGDGQVVVGEAVVRETVGDRLHAFRWTSATGMVDLGLNDMPSYERHSHAQAASDDGSVVVGLGENEAGAFHAFQRDASGTISELATLPEMVESAAYGVSDDGSLIVGWNRSSGRTRRPVLWENGVPRDLGAFTLEIDSFTLARDISGDGSTIVGVSVNGSFRRACIFSQTGGSPIDLDPLNEFPGHSSARAVSQDGKVVIGSSAAIEEGAFIWTAEDGMVPLGSLPTTFEPRSSTAAGLSADGRVIVGSSNNDGMQGGDAALWIDRDLRQLYEYLVAEYGAASVAGWKRFDLIYDVSDDGRVLVGIGALTTGEEGCAFRITLPPNSPPTITIPAAKTIECTGAKNVVTLSAKTIDSDARDRLTVTWTIDGAVKKTTPNVVPGATISFEYDYPHGTTEVGVQVTDGKASASETTSVTVADTTSPIVIVVPTVKAFVDRGKLFATLKPTPPTVRDVCDPDPALTSDAPGNRRYPLGTTKVRWTVTDESGNVAKAVQKVTVQNRDPKANAGPDVTAKTRKGTAKVELNGSRSTDPDRHVLEYSWKANGGSIADSDAAKTSGTFKVGKTKVTLTVTDEAGAKSIDSMIVNVRRVRRARAGAIQADSAVRESYASGARSAGQKSGGSSSAAGLQLAASAYALGALAGDDLGATGSPTANDLAAYAALRRQQSTTSYLAGRSFYDSFLIGGDENALSASLHAYAAGAYAESDLASNEFVEALAATVEETE